MSTLVPRPNRWGFFLTKSYITPPPFPHTMNTALEFYIYLTLYLAINIYDILILRSKVSRWRSGSTGLAEMVPRARSFIFDIAPYPLSTFFKYLPV
jgi:hypothetical protein